MVGATGAALLGFIVPPAVAANLTGNDYSTGIPSAADDREVGKAAVCPQTQDLEALPKRRIGDPSAPPAAAVSNLAWTVAPKLGAYRYRDLSAVHRTARRNVAAQPRAPPASRS